MTLAAPITNSNVKYILSVVEPIFKTKTLGSMFISQERKISKYDFHVISFFLVLNHLMQFELLDYL